MKTSLLLNAILGTMLLTACSDQTPAENRTTAGAVMKCGAGKCGANMAGGNSALAKKRHNILSQMRDSDPRRGCVTKAPSASALYDCVRDPETGRLTTKCGIRDTNAAMKCGAGKCGAP